MFDDGYLGLDVKSFLVLSGSERIFLSVVDGYGVVMVNWVKMVFVNIMVITLIEDLIVVVLGEINE